ncbi:MmcQ/YjbR family DNA-binding protein [uncultured Treponema sp.]|uniref:MmcQ/YjbR family DNA-binding protein n=1 Tax=uncultured Treponema sp. TaxID=162155 RepID=UPI0025E2492E|nr:MmcQ/YjbR family DNA-binding protein [uncultured Treponema sp.]
MDYSYILNSALPQKEKLKAFGFIESDGVLNLKKNIADGEFYAKIRLSEKSFCAEVFETLTDEKYVLFDVKSANGAFVGQIRSEVQTLIEEIRTKCFDFQDIRQKYVDFLHSEFSAPGDTPWSDEGDFKSTVYRCPNEKWFALVMEIKFKNLGFESDEAVWVVNLKADAEKIPEITDKKSIFPAYHMNKKYWITVLLTAVTDFEQLCDLTRRSYELVSDKR